MAQVWEKELVISEKPQREWAIFLFFSFSDKHTEVLENSLREMGSQSRSSSIVLEFLSFG
jgi:hypothetical protein